MKYFSSLVETAFIFGFYSVKCMKNVNFNDGTVFPHTLVPSRL